MDVNSGLSSDIINKLFVIDDILFVYSQQGLNYKTSKESYFKSVDSDDGLTLSNFNSLSFLINDKLLINSKNGQFSVDIPLLTNSSSASNVVVKEII